MPYTARDTRSGRQLNAYGFTDQRRPPSKHGRTRRRRSKGCIQKLSKRGPNQGSGDRKSPSGVQGLTSGVQKLKQNVNLLLMFSVENLGFNLQEQSWDSIFVHTYNSKLNLRMQQGPNLSLTPIWVRHCTQLTAGLTYGSVSVAQHHLIARRQAT